MLFVIGSDNIWSMHMLGVYPFIIAVQKPLPFDKVLQPSLFPKSLMIKDSFDFLLFFTINKIWGWTQEVQTVFGSLLIGQ